MELRNLSNGLTLLIYPAEKINRLQTAFTLYIVIGMILIVTNYLIVLAVILYKKLRIHKEFVMVAGLALVDGTNGFGFLLAGTLRLIAIDSGDYFILVSKRVCILKLWNLIWVWCIPLARLLLLVISIDRLLSVFVPFRYSRLTNRYAFGVLATVYALMIIQGLVGGFFAYGHQEHIVRAYCCSSLSLTKVFSRLRRHIMLVSSILSILLYLPVLWKIAHPLSCNESTKLSGQQLARLKRITKAYSVNAFFTFTFYVILDFLPLLNLYNDNVSLYLLMTIKPMANIFIYSLKIKEIRLGVKGILKCSRLYPRDKTVVHPNPSEFVLGNYSVNIIDKH